MKGTAESDRNSCDDARREKYETARIHLRVCSRVENLVKIDVNVCKHHLYCVESDEVRTSLWRPATQHQRRPSATDGDEEKEATVSATR